MHLCQVTTRDDTGLENATYLGSVSVTDTDQVVTGDSVTSVTAPYLQFVENTGDMCGTGNMYSSGPGTVYVSPSLYPSSSSPTTPTYFDSTTTLATGYATGANTGGLLF